MDEGRVLRFASSTWPAIFSGVTEDVVRKWQRRGVAVKSGEQEGHPSAPRHRGDRHGVALSHGERCSAECQSCTSCRAEGDSPPEAQTPGCPKARGHGAQCKFQLSTTWLRSLMRNAGMTFRKGTTDVQTASFTAAEIEKVRLVPQSESWGFPWIFYGFPRFLRMVGRASRGTDQFATQVAVDYGATFGEAGECVELRRNCGGHSAPRLFGLGEQRAEKDRFRWHRRQAELDSARRGHLHVGRQDIVSGDCRWLNSPVLGRLDCASWFSLARFLTEPLDN